MQITCHIVVGEPHHAYTLLTFVVQVTEQRVLETRGWATMPSLGAMISPLSCL
jgi:hypothetical protein